ncbi:MAG: Lrp/AsnC ligand binding domain-containing protein [Candidatus Thorarchaeota archaeon]
MAVVLAYVLILAKSGREYDIIESLKEFPQVKQANTVLGSWDIIVAVESESMEALYILVERIRALRNVERTSTLITR